MPERSLSFSLVLAMSFALALPSFAQTATTETPTTPTAETPATDAPATDAPAATTDLSTGQPAEKTAPEPYVKATHGDWTLRCLHAKSGSDPCEIYQLLKDEKGNSVAEITMIALPDGSEALVGATVVVPLETLLTAQLRLAVDGAEAKVYPYSFCAPVGCFSRIGFTSPELEALKKGAKAVITVVPAAAPEKSVTVNVSLNGFTAAYEAVKAERPKSQ